jgi:hypothetical protein
MAYNFNHVRSNGLRQVTPRFPHLRAHSVVVIEQNSITLPQLCHHSLDQTKKPHKYLRAHFDISQRFQAPQDIEKAVHFKESSCLEGR